jgi:predicted AAA+ superfamily ATPase
VYQVIFADPIGQAFRQLLHQLHTVSAGLATTHVPLVSAYAAWFHLVAAQQQGWQDYLFERLISTPNPLSQQVQQTYWADLPSALRQAVSYDFRILQQIYHCGCDQILAWVQSTANPEIPLVAWVDRLAPVLLPTGQGRAAAELRSQFQHGSDWSEAIPTLIAYYRRFGTGPWAQFRAFRWHQGELIAIPEPDPVRLSSLVGYEWQRDAIVHNTQALLQGYPALNVLLYGSRGSGKSSLIKSLLHQFEDEGLRLIEVSKTDLVHLPTILEQIRHQPQKFVIFVDDLSFEEDNDAYKALKVILEGSLTARPRNVVVYATSNRRHLVREFFADRPQPRDQDEVHSWDTVQEKLSFSDRFGLTLTFEPADQATYLQIVNHLAGIEGIRLSSADLEFRALQWATQHNGRSGRTARQFIDWLKAEVALGRV